VNPVSTVTTQNMVEAVADESLRQVRGSSYGEALKSTAAIGGASVINILLGVVRTKCVALAVGPSGIGLLGTFNAITALVSAVAGMGIQASGVRQIAEAAGKNDSAVIGKTVKALRRTTLVLGLCGTAAMALLAPWLSQWTFENKEYTVPLTLLALTVLFGSVSNGQLALIQGMRRIGDLVRVNVIGAALGTLVSVPMVWLWGIRGIVPFLLTVSAMAIVTSWWYARKTVVPPVQLSWGKTISEGAPLLKLGFAFMGSGLMSLGVAYLLRLMILRRLGLESAGHYQAAATLASMYVGFVLSAMGTDFYPRLTAVSQDDAAMNRMVNEQAEVSFLLATPGVLATLTLAPLVISVFYSGAFTEAVDVLRWQVLGVLLRVASWPFGYAVLARARGRLYFLTELAGNAWHLAALWLGIQLFGLHGTGMAFFSQYVFYWLMMYWVARGSIGFRYSLASGRILRVILPATACVFAAEQLLSPLAALPLALCVTAAVSYYCLRALVALVPDSRPVLRLRMLCNRSGFPL